MISEQKFYHALNKIVEDSDYEQYMKWAKFAQSMNYDLNINSTQEDILMGLDSVKYLYGLDIAQKIYKNCIGDYVILPEELDDAGFYLFNGGTIDKLLEIIKNDKFELLWDHDEEPEL